ncbi:hypothetical protein HNR39_001554 [Glaciimonas immobilis]|uniref:Uncharacterized protein n=1 Tax=Glaciimonas immobilis TaxID=728004 RepID=A0A840RRE6_9BURK|nr:hypothetical protein [Glaciimonas immobilis]
MDNPFKGGYWRGDRVFAYQGKYVDLKPQQNTSRCLSLPRIEFMGVPTRAL